MKRFKKMTIMLITAITILSCFSIFASATLDSSFERIIEIHNVKYDNDDNHECKNISGIATGMKTTTNGGQIINYNSLFVAKCRDKNNFTDIAFYYFPNMHNTNNKRVFRVKYAGHANAMTIDSTNIYLTASMSSSNHDPNYPHGAGTTLIQINRSYLASLSDGATINLDNPNTNVIDGYQAIKPVTYSNGTYTDYTASIGNITKFSANQEFIISYSLSSVASGFCFTKATIQTINGEKKLVVSTDPADIFIVKNETGFTPYTHPDLEYYPSHGLFIPKWKGESGCENSILWIPSLSSSYTWKTIGGNQYREYTPTAITVDATNIVEYNVQKYTTFELEAVAMTAENELIFSANEIVTTAFQTAYKNATGGKYYHDGIFKLKHSNGTQWTF